MTSINFLWAILLEMIISRKLCNDALTLLFQDFHSFSEKNFWRQCSCWLNGNCMGKKIEIIIMKEVQLYIRTFIYVLQQLATVIRGCLMTRIRRDNKLNKVTNTSYFWENCKMPWFFSTDNESWGFFLFSWACSASRQGDKTPKTFKSQGIIGHAPKEAVIKGTKCHKSRALTIGTHYRSANRLFSVRLMDWILLIHPPE